MSPVHSDAAEPVLERIIPVMSAEDPSDTLVHIAYLTSSCIYTINCIGEDTALAWKGCGDATPTCLRCLATRPWRRNDAGILVREGPGRIEFDTETR
jgi:hypothetical protein